MPITSRTPFCAAAEMGLARRHARSFENFFLQKLFALLTEGIPAARSSIRAASHLSWLSGGEITTSQRGRRAAALARMQVYYLHIPCYRFSCRYS